METCTPCVAALSNFPVIVRSLAASLTLSLLARCSSKLSIASPKDPFSAVFLWVRPGKAGLGQDKEEAHPPPPLPILPQSTMSAPAAFRLPCVTSVTTLAMHAQAAAKGIGFDPASKFCERGV